MPQWMDGSSWLALALALALSQTQGTQATRRRRSLDRETQSMPEFFNLLHVIRTDHDVSSSRP
jgi:hypothetical protein